jgi:hypothetical protein
VFLFPETSKHIPILMLCLLACGPYFGVVFQTSQSFYLLLTFICIARRTCNAIIQFALLGAHVMQLCNQTWQRNPK